jgi:NAD-dependent deacetylase
VTTDTPHSDLQRAADLILSADSVIALTGAGISTPSGIPDFRSPGSGLWERVNPMEVASILAFRYNPERFYEWMRPMADLILKAEPNPAHIALVQLEQSSHMKGLITQNIDGLHGRAGSKRVIEIHGHLRRATCISCFQSCATDEMFIEFAESGRIPRCEKCDGILKPDAVLFGEQLPVDSVREAQRWIKNCDLLITAGSSLEVVPVALFPVDALNAGARLIIFNNAPTYVDDRADVIFRQDVAESLPQLVAEVMRG